MLVRIAKAALLSNSFSTSSQKWRQAIQSKQLVSQISTLLLQRTNWSALLPRRLPLTPSLLRRILHRTRSHPKLSLSFFHFATSSLPGLRPDLPTITGLITLLVRSNLPQQAHALLKPLIPSIPVAALVDAVLEDAADQGTVLDFLLRIYSEGGLLTESLYLLAIIRLRGSPLVGGSNALLVALCRSSDAGLVWPCYGVLLRSGVVPDSEMWSTLARVLGREGKLNRSLVLLKYGNASVDMYDLLIDCASSSDDLVLAVELLNEMESKGIVPSISTYSSIFDGACKFGDSCLTNTMLSRMVENGLLPTMPFTDYDLVIEKFCRLKKSYAVGMLYEKCRVKKIDLRPSSYVCIMQIFCEEGRKDEAIGVYELIRRKGIRLSSSEAYNALWSILFRDAKFEEVGHLMKDALKRGLTPNVSDLSRYYGCLCGEGKWDQAAHLLTMVLDNGFLPHGLDCSSLVEYYCSNGQVDIALSLHHKFEKLGGGLDVSSYNAILERLTAEKRTKEAVQMFDYMRIKDTGNSKSFVLIIAALCCERDMRKAMILHDEMVKKGLKPDDDTYKCLIAGFC